MSTHETLKKISSKNSKASTNNNKQAVKDVKPIATELSLPSSSSSNGIYSRIIKEAFTNLAQEGRLKVGMMGLYHHLVKNNKIKESKRTWNYLKIALREGIKRGEYSMAGSKFGCYGRFSASNEALATVKRGKYLKKVGVE